MGKWFFRMTAVVLTPLCALILIGVGIVQGSMPASFTVNEGEVLVSDGERRRRSRHPAHRV